MIAVLSLLLFVRSSAAAPGDLDESFSGNGLAPLAVPEEPRAIAVQADGSGVVVGHSTDLEDQRAQIVRYGPDGSVDGSFAAASTLDQLTPVGSGLVSSANDLAVTGDDGIVISASIGRPGSNFETRIIRLLADGSPDPSFGSGGSVTLDVDNADDLILDRSGRILVLGPESLARLRPDGSLDPGFAGDGVQESLPQRPDSIAVAGDGSIYLGGDVSPPSPPEQQGLSRLKDDGTIDTEFAAGGTLPFAPSPYFIQGVSSLVVLDDGAVIVATRGCSAIGFGPSAGPGSCESSVFKVLHSGEIDEGFGARIAETGTVSDRLVLDDSGGILAAGERLPGRRYPSAFALGRIDSEGFADPGFGVDGIAYAYRGFQGGVALAAVPTSGERILVLAPDRLLSFEAGVGRRDSDADGRANSKDRCDLFAAPRRAGCPSIDRRARLNRTDLPRGIAIRLEAELDVCAERQRIVVFRAVLGRDRAVASRVSDTLHRKAQFRGLADGRYYGAVRRNRARGIGWCKPAKTQTITIGPRPTGVPQ